MDEGTPVFRVECGEPEGEVVRTVSKVSLSLDRLQHYYEQLEEYDVLFNELVKTFDDWVQQFVHIRDDGKVEPTGLIWQVDDVGILFLTEIRPGHQALGHFTFWDGRLRGREELMREWIRYLFMKYDFHRLEAEVGLYAKPALNFVERIGLTKEGRKREARLYQPNGEPEPEWWDVNLYSVLESEV